MHNHFHYCIILSNLKALHLSNRDMKVEGKAQLVSGTPQQGVIMFTFTLNHLIGLLYHEENHFDAAERQ